MALRDNKGRFFKGCESPRKGNRYPQGEKNVEKECIICAKHFFVNKCHSFARFCCGRCAEKGYRLANKQKVIKYKHLNYRKLMSLRRGVIYDKKTGRKKGICPVCGKIFLGFAHREFCSRYCWARQFRNKNRVIIREKHRIYSITDNLRHIERKKIRKHTYDTQRILILAFFGRTCVLCHKPFTNRRAGKPTTLVVG